MQLTDALREEASRLLADPRILGDGSQVGDVPEEIRWIAGQFAPSEGSAGPSWEKVFASAPGARTVKEVVPLTAERIETRRRVAELTGQRFGCYRLAAIMREIILADCEQFYGMNSRETHRAEKSLLAARNTIPTR